MIMHRLAVQRTAVVRPGALVRLQVGKRPSNSIVTQIRKTESGTRPLHVNDKRKATLCSSTSADRGGALVATRDIPEGRLSYEDEGPVASGSSVATRFVPAGMLSREDSQIRDSQISPSVHRDVPEGMLSREELSDTERESDQRQFNWFQQWYPVAALDALDPTRPHAFTLLHTNPHLHRNATVGQDLVLWRDGSGRWRAFKDACPHRLAPLSEGRIEKDGTLLCAYHAWRFDGSGACTAMPFCSPDDPGRRNPRSCAVSYPALERGGLLWVWAQGGPGAEEAAAAKQPPVPPEVQDDGRPRAGVTCMGDRYKDPRPFQLEVTLPPSLEEGFKVHLPNSKSETVREAYTDFTPPGLVRIQSENRDGSRTILALFSTPIRPGWTRLIMVSSPDNEGGGRSVVGFVGSKMLPVWLAHLLGPLFLHQDLLFLHYQERAVMRQQLERKLKQQQRQQREGEEAAAASDVEGTDLSLPPPQYFTPGTADKAVAAWCTWLTKFAGGDVTYAPAGNGVLSVVLHAAGWLVGSWEGLGLLVVAAVAAGVVLVTTKLEQMMHKYEFSHADNH
ncbi:hypothetical protein VOLCADRAFT_100270 [Volvox carteri f. nagariensis]|uniref:Rieske domain-containing protein n=1 Tax=Volvox carteri f. nagariensis TaxID=3068 RepID=D8UJV7_VOLCA|nr:uncharacterized protein VOLCADRAFT_100270 [Volvox carteri f. nagariensis]EFJ39989.1 hypothetical protein VOLCADRAFT_100270 [Volvox carteri f. nagariensis]|eukprot:XP_002958954.1 hypothetical protein VOLCADRAFT_100270 [Volvox carteri f. nagariensis]